MSNPPIPPSPSPDEIEKLESIRKDHANGLIHCAYLQDVGFLLNYIQAQQSALRGAEDKLHEIIFYEKEVYDYEPLDGKAADNMVIIAEEAREILQPFLPKQS